MKIAYDVNRVIDDFIMICFFVGNDFLPRVFCFDIRLGTLEDLINLFKQHVIEASDYLNDRGRINWKEFTRLMKRLSRFERVAMENRESEIIEFFNSLESEQYDDAQLKVH
jgi:5'-3' exoribonuclease 1